jgi:hypothetical protein
MEIPLGEPVSILDVETGPKEGKLGPEGRVPTWDG